MSPDAAARVICLGEALVDRLGPPGGTPERGPWDDRLGGAPANVACGLARLGTATALLTRLGRDAAGRSFRDLLSGRGVAMAGVQEDPERPTRVVLVRRDADGERHFGGFHGDRGAGFADQALSPASLGEALTPMLAEAGWLLVGTIPMASHPSAEAHALALRLAAEAGVPIALDVNWRPSFWRSSAAQARLAILAVLPQVRLLKLAAEEAEWLFGERDPAAIRLALPQRPAVLVTDGARPLQWCVAGESGRQEAFDVAVVDTTGAGDAFTAGLLHRLAARPGLLEQADPTALAAAMRFAAACGALTCTAAGAIDAQPGADAVRRLLEG
jgi:fructokinase